MAQERTKRELLADIDRLQFKLDNAEAELETIQTGGAEADREHPLPVDVQRALRRNVDSGGSGGQLAITCCLKYRIPRNV
jgi:hypothetical protein